MPEIQADATGIEAIVAELIAAGMAQAVAEYGHLGSSALPERLNDVPELLARHRFFVVDAKLMAFSRYAPRSGIRTISYCIAQAARTGGA